MPHKHIGFNPCKTDLFCSVWSVADAWGRFAVENNSVKLFVGGGTVTLCSLGLKFCKHISALKIDGADVDFCFNDGVVSFAETKIKAALELSCKKYADKKCFYCK